MELAVWNPRQDHLLFGSRHRPGPLRVAVRKAVADAAHNEKVISALRQSGVVLRELRSYCGRPRPQVNNLLYRIGLTLGAIEEALAESEVDRVKGR
jgi:hypothetical protein